MCPCAPLDCSIQCCIITDCGRRKSACRYSAGYVYAPSRTPRKIDFPSPVSFEIQSLKHRIVGFVTDTGHDYELQAGNKSDPVRSQPGFELGPLFQRISVDPG